MQESVDNQGDRGERKERLYRPLRWSRRGFEAKSVSSAKSPSRISAYSAGERRGSAGRRMQG